MNKSDLVSVISTKAQVVKAVAAETLEAILEAITQSLRGDESITLVGFGTFAVRERKERIGRNPKTGKALKISASKVVYFKAGKLLKDAVQQNTSNK